MKDRNELPPSGDFAAYLASPYHARRMEAAKGRMLQRMNNYHVTEVYPAISEALGVMAALGDFYTASGTAPRSAIAELAGDPRPNRPTFDQVGDAAAPDEKPRRAGYVRQVKFTEMDLAIVRFLSDGEIHSRDDIMKAARSTATTAESMDAKVRVVRRKLANTGILIEAASDGHYMMPKPSCVLAIAMLDGAV